MQPYYENGKAKLYNGHALEVLRTLETESVQTCVTSPPYFGLRAYGTEPQVWGGEDVCEHVWGEEGKSGQRIRHGEDSGFRDMDTPKHAANVTLNPSTGSFCNTCGAWRGELGLEPTPELFIEHLVLIFREVRRVLRKDGTLWVNIGDSYAGSGKGGNPDDSKWKGYVGSSQREAAATAHAGKDRLYGCKPKDLIGVPWMLAFALRSDGWYLRSDIIWHKPNPMPESVTDRPTKAHEYIFLLSKSQSYYYDHGAIAEPIKSESIQRAMRGVGDTHKNIAVPGRTTHTMHKARANGEEYPLPEKRNKRSVWTVNTQPNELAHYATYPTELIKPCILAGAPEGGTVLDPFNGSGTTGVVAITNKRKYVGIELNVDYCEMSKTLLSRAAGIPADFPKQIRTHAPTPLFESLACDG